MPNVTHNCTQQAFQGDHCLQEKEATGISWVYMGCQLSDVAAESLSRHAAENDQTTRALRLNLDDFDDNSKSAAKILRDAGHGE